MFGRLMRNGIDWTTTNLRHNTTKVWHCLSGRPLKTGSNGRTNDSYFITTPIFYVNSVPHIGHMYSALIADAFHRFERMLGTSRTIFSTGTDEHGIKIQRAADSSGVEPQLFCDRISDQFRSLFEKSDIGFTHFIRTTDECHKRAVKTFWTTVMNNGFIYKSSYEGWYCPSDETFVTESQILVTDTKMRLSAESGNAVEWSSEENYIFRLSQFQDSLLKWLESGDTVRPKIFADILQSEVQKGLRDISVSRPKSRLSWGIEVPNDCSQIIYVWFDALINYLTVSGYPDDCNHLWPPDCQVIGKDILKFHGIYWPAFLMAANLEPPRLLLCHSHWLKDDIKMSKSKGNVVDPFDCIHRYTSDGFRYFLLRQGSLHSDSNFNAKKVQEYLNSELADTLGNLLGRSTVKTINKSQSFPLLSESDLIVNDSQSSDLIDHIKSLADICKTHYSSGNFYLGINEIMECLRLNNAFLNQTKPWLLAKDSAKEAELQSILMITLEALRVSAILLQPIVPNLSDKILNKLNVNPSERHWIHAKRAFEWRNASNAVFKEQNSVLFAKIK